MISRAVLKKTTAFRRMVATVYWVVLLAVGLASSTSRAFTALYVFGDSLSDTGRNPAPGGSYFNGRYCNGPLWVEYLSAQLGLPYNASNNFAVSGSTTGDLLSQVAGVPASTNLHSALFTVLSGGNDFLDNLGLGVNDAGWNTVLTNAVFNFTNALDQLYTNGAREVIVGNLANLGKIPLVLATSSSYASYIGTKVSLFDAMLASATTNVMQRSAGFRVYFLDDYTILSNVLSAPAQYGFTVTTNGALEDPNLADRSFNGPGANYLFWDSVHPTTKFDALVAAAAFAHVAVQLNLARSGTNYSLAISNLNPGLPYIVQGSTNFINWTNYNTFTASGTNSTLTVTNGVASRVFYRMEY